MCLERLIRTKDSWRSTKGKKFLCILHLMYSEANLHSVIPNTLRVIPTTVVTFLVYENTKLYLPKVFDDDEQQSHDED
jgi:hypothetical protein